MMHTHAGHVSHQMLLCKTSTFVHLDKAIAYDNNLEILHENRESFNRIYIPQFTWDRYQNEIKLEMEFVWGHQMYPAMLKDDYLKIIYEDIVLNNKTYGFKDLSLHNFILTKNKSISFVDLESYGLHSIAKRRAEFLSGICQFPKKYLPPRVGALNYVE